MTFPRLVPAALALGVACLAGPLAAPAAAQPALPAADPRVALTLTTENDSYSFRKGDRWYTNGIYLGFQSAEDRLPSPMAWLDGRLAELFGPARSRWGISVGQNLYTPIDIRRTVPDRQDRPYAGFLYTEISLDRRTATHLDRFSFQLGLVGPSALGEETQDFVHDVLGDRQARGWRYQIRDEVTFNFQGERTWRLPGGAMPALGLETDVLPTASVALGTAAINAGLGARVRIGSGLENDFGPPRIRPTLGTTGSAPVGNAFGWYLFAGAGGRVVGRDITLNGNTYRDSASRDPRPFVGDLEAGGALVWRGARLSYTHVWRTKEFVSQAGTFQFGSINLTLMF